MVFSVMHLFNVSLDPSHFSVDDRNGAAIALIKQILQRTHDEGERKMKGHWLGALYFITPSPQISTLPLFPETSVGGLAYVVQADGERRLAADIMEKYISDVKGTFRMYLFPDGGKDFGKMDDTGCYTFKARFLLPILRAGDSTSNSNSESTKGWNETGPILAADGSQWHIYKTGNAHIKDAEALGIYFGQNSMNFDVFLIVESYQNGKKIGLKDPRYRRVSHVLLDCTNNLRENDSDFVQREWFQYVDCSKTICIE